MTTSTAVRKKNSLHMCVSPIAAHSLATHRINFGAHPRLLDAVSVGAVPDVQMAARKRPRGTEVKWHTIAAAVLAEADQADDIVIVQKQLGKLQEQATERLRELHGNAGNQEHNALASAQRALQQLLAFKTSNINALDPCQMQAQPWHPGVCVCVLPCVPAATCTSTCLPLVLMHGASRAA